MHSVLLCGGSFVLGVKERDGGWVAVLLTSGVWQKRTGVSGSSEVAVALPASCFRTQAAGQGAGWIVCPTHHFSQGGSWLC